MTNPTENEEINEELSTDELKSVSGGIQAGGVEVEFRSKSPHGSGSGKTKADFERANKYGGSGEGSGGNGF